MKFGRIAAAGIAAAMMTAAVPFTATAEETAEPKHIVVLGDGISSGAGLDGLSYASLLSGYMKADIANFAQDGYTTDDVLASLNQSNVKAALADADIILVSAGLHDVMDPYIALAYEYMEEFGLSSFSDLFSKPRSEVDLTDTQMMQRSAALGAKARENKESAVSNILEIGETLSQYQNAQVIYLNVYNSMNTIENYSQLSTNRQTAYTAGVLSPISGVLNDSDGINSAYSEIAESYSCTVVDTFTLFSGLAYKYSYPTELNPELNADGQALLALETAKAAGVFKYGNLDGDDDVSASDAADVLEHAASVGSGDGGTLNALQAFAADVNNDNAVDASDAAAILEYAAIRGAGGTPSFETLGY